MQNSKDDNRNKSACEPLDYLANSTLKDLTVSLKVLYPSIDVDNDNNDGKCKMINIDGFSKWLEEISYNENKSNNVFEDLKPNFTYNTSSPDDLCPIFDPINLQNTMDEMEPIDIEDFAEWIDDISFDKSIEIEDFLNDDDDEPSLITITDSIEPLLSDFRIVKDDSTMMAPMYLYNQTQNNIPTDDLADSILNKLEAAMLKTQMSRQCFKSNGTFSTSNIDFSMSKQKNNLDMNDLFCATTGESRNISRSHSTQLLGKRKSIATKIQESQKRLKLLRVQNTVLMNSKFLTGSCKRGRNSATL